MYYSITPHPHFMTVRKLFCVTLLPTQKLIQQSDTLKIIICFGPWNILWFLKKHRFHLSQQIAMYIFQNKHLIISRTFYILDL